MARRAESGELFWGYGIGEHGRLMAVLLDAPRSIGRDSLVEIEVGNGERITATSDHQFVLRAGIYGDQTGTHRHHRDFDRRNNRPMNIEGMPAVEHIRLHNAESHGDGFDTAICERLVEARRNPTVAARQHHRDAMLRPGKVGGDRVVRAGDVRTRSRSRGCCPWRGSP